MSWATLVYLAIWSIWLVSYNQTNQTDRTNHMNKTGWSQTPRALDAWRDPRSSPPTGQADEGYSESAACSALPHPLGAMCACGSPGETDPAALHTARRGRRSPIDSTDAAVSGPAGWRSPGHDLRAGLGERGPATWSSDGWSGWRWIPRHGLTRRARRTGRNGSRQAGCWHHTVLRRSHGP
jgi:hypothetical protein